ncbi:MAG: DUF3575 domain-containing protein [Flavobacterium sp.]|uniref:DUF3575 domain-containing protein n=1 Tax=Flavobacterium sp. TaxID=239 RepID=UPI00261A9E14|nr:DUF3575 domain-containing protein [Flavobacterium sp.]MDD5149190.1 DUF3575 domain-containing protein [Flavobacterium sp.]
MKKLLIITILLFSVFSQAQTYIKGNAVTALVLVPNIGIETSIGKKITFQADVMGSFWKSFKGHHPMEFYSLIAEVRYHFNEKYNGFYFGGHAGADRYMLQKWNYWGSNKYEDGFGYKFGGTIGYEKKLKDRFMLDFFVGGGWHQGYYHGYYNDGTPGRYEKAKHWNMSGDWLPYRGGVMVSYRLN